MLKFAFQRLKGVKGVKGVKGLKRFLHLYKNVDKY
jgi:hypothetical protein